MKRLNVILVTLLLTFSSFGQGVIFFINRTTTGDARVTRLTPRGVGAGAGFTAQLFLVRRSALTPLTPTTTFRDTSAATAYFVYPVDIIVPGVPAGSAATFRMRVFETAAGSYDAAATSPGFAFGESNDVFVQQLGGITATGNIVPTPDLAGLQGFYVIPEPSSVPLGIVGAAALLYRCRQ